jgi:hypothetical protein
LEDDEQDGWLHHSDTGFGDWGSYEGTTMTLMKPNLGRPTDFRVFLRIYPGESNLNVERAKEILRIAETDPAFQSTFLDEDDEIMVLVFNSGEPLHGDPPMTDDELGEIEKWQKPEFRVAGQWFRERTSFDFKRLTETGLRADFCVKAYNGLVPRVILEELVRLGIDIWIFS